jgi:hypothetical protein
VIAPASTGNDNNNKIVVSNTDHTNKGKRSMFISEERIFIIVVMKLIELKIEEIPARCREKMVKSTLPPLCEILDDKGG